jgi:hypothetical protein
VSNDLDPSEFFRDELAGAIREIRREYETSLADRRHSMQSRYSLLYEHIIHTQQMNTNPQLNQQQQRQVERMRVEFLQARNQNNYVSAKNQDSEYRIDGLRKKLDELRQEGKSIETFFCVFLLLY